jgi:putative membrane protein
MKTGLRCTALLLAWTAFSLGPSVASAAPRGDRSGLTAATVSEADRHFVLQALEDGLAGAALAQLAARRAASPEVRRFARHLEDAQAAANRTLLELAQSKGIPVPQAAMAEVPPARVRPKPRGEAAKTNQQAVDNLAKLKGAAFDREYVREAVPAHDQAVELFERQASGGGDQDLKAWVSRTLPALREQQRRARDLDGQLQKTAERLEH